MSKRFLRIFGSITGLSALVGAGLTWHLLSTVVRFMAYQEAHDVSGMEIVAVIVFSTAMLLAAGVTMMFLWITYATFRSAVTGCKLPEALTGPTQNTDRG